MLKSIYDCPQIIYTLYTQSKVPDEDIIAFVQDKEDIPVVVIPKKRVGSEFIAKLHEVGKYTYSHTFDDIEELQTYFDMGVDGFFTNAILPSELKERYPDEFDRSSCPFHLF